MESSEVLEARVLEDIDDLVEFSSLPVITAVYSVPIQHKSTQTSNEALDHEDQHGGNWPCRLCPAAFKTKDTLLNHRRLVHSVDERYILFDIPSTTTAANSLKSSNCSETLPDVPPTKVSNSLACLKCNKTFRNSYQKAVHDKNVHKSLNGFKFKCFDCFQGFENRSQWMIHQKAHKNKFVRCLLCPKVFTDDRKLKIHKQAKHKDPINNKAGKCSKCDEVFSTIKGLTAHENSHGDKWPCDLCPAGYKMLTAFSKHRDKFHPHATTKYDFQQPNSSTFQQPKKTYNCIKCNPIRQFETLPKLCLHIEKDHKDTFKFKCSKCDEKFRILSQKIKHEKSHFPISCLQCPNLLFYSVCDLYTHRSRFHPMKVKCSKCEEIFSTVYQRDRHEMVHGDGWPCLLCLVGFRSKQSVLRHRKKFHPEAEEYL